MSGKRASLIAHRQGYSAWVLLIVLGTAVTNGACAGHAAQSPPPAANPPPRASTSAAVSHGDAQADASVETRAQQYWARRQAKDLAGAYPFYCTAYHSKVSQAQFLQLTRLVRFNLLEVHVADVKLTNTKAAVTIKYRFVVPTLPEPAVDGQTTDIWARDSDGQWCKEDEPLILPFPRPPGSPPIASVDFLRSTHRR